MSACSARLARSTRPMSGLRSGLPRSLDIRKDSFQYIDRIPYSIRSGHGREPLPPSGDRSVPRRPRPTDHGGGARARAARRPTPRPGRAVPIDRVRAAIGGARYAAYAGFEPGGQVELSWPCAPDPATLVRRVRSDLTALRADCLAAGVLLTPRPVDSRPEAEVPLQLDKPRYVAMQRHFDSIGPAGRRMMRRTASTQVCLDWWPGAAGLEQWRLLNLAGPFLAAAFARPGPDRLATWLAVDPARTAFDGRLLSRRRPGGGVRRVRRRRHRRSSRRASEHLTTLFPPVRPRGRYLEVRFPDVQEDDAIGTAGRPRSPRCCTTTTCRAQALRRLAGEEPRLERALVRRGARSRRRRRPRPRARRADRCPADGRWPRDRRAVRRRPAGGPAGRHRRQRRADGGHPGASVPTCGSAGPRTSRSSAAG